MYSRIVEHLDLVVEVMDNYPKDEVTLRVIVKTPRGDRSTSHVLPRWRFEEDAMLMTDRLMHEAVAVHVVTPMVEAMQHRYTEESVRWFGPLARGRRAGWPWNP
jgi:hypothetical protein